MKNYRELRLPDRWVTDEERVAGAMVIELKRGGGRIKGTRERRVESGTMQRVLRPTIPGGLSREEVREAEERCVCNQAKLERRGGRIEGVREHRHLQKEG